MTDRRSRRPGRSVVIGLISCLALGNFVTPTEVAAVDEVVFRTRGDVGPLGAVTVIGDSVLKGSVWSPWGTPLDAHLVSQGWGPVRVRAGVGDNTGNFGTAPTTRASYWIETWRAQGWDPEHLLINLGANDSAACAGNESCAYDAITFLADVIGPGHKIWWPKVTRHPVLEHHAAAWNRALDRVAAERPGSFFTWDWPSVMYQLDNYESDHTHLTPQGYRERSVIMAHEFTADLAEAQRVGGAAPLPDPLGEPTEYVPRTPTRIVDTRRDPPGRLDARETLTVDMTPHVPEGTTAVAVNLTSAGTDTGGFLSAYPCDRTRRAVSSVNHDPGVPRGAMAIVPLSADGELCVHTEAAGHVVVDLQGAFVPEGGAGFTPIDGRRLVDTRDTGRRNPIVIDIDDPSVEAIAVNLTATRGAATGFLTADACEGGRSPVSNVNFLPGEPVAGAAIVPVSDDGRICVWSSVGVDVIVDLTGEFRTGEGLRFQPADPSRTLDVRDGTGGWAPLTGAGQLLDSRVAPSQAEAVTGTITLVRPMRTGFAVADCRADPPVSNVNATAGAAMANSLTVALEPGGKLCFRSSQAAKLLFDTTGWWVP
jgi:hypothetical protein